MTGKKKSKSFIIPATAFRTIIPAAPKKTVTQPIVKEEITNVVAEESKPIATTPKSDAQKATPTRRKASALSLKSLKTQQSSDNELNKKESEESIKNLPKTPFDLIKATEVWNRYVEHLLQQGKKSLASIMKMNNITLNGNEIQLVLPNSLVDTQLKMAQTPLLEFLRKELNNYHISIKTTVNEQKSKDFVYTPQEKYEKLKEKNSHIELLKKTFFLDV